MLNNQIEQDVNCVYGLLLPWLPIMHHMLQMHLIYDGGLFIMGFFSVVALPLALGHPCLLHLRVSFHLRAVIKRWSSICILRIPERKERKREKK